MKSNRHPGGLAAMLQAALQSASPRILTRRSASRRPCRSARRSRRVICATSRRTHTATAVSPRGQNPNAIDVRPLLESASGLLGPSRTPAVGGNRMADEYIAAAARRAWRARVLSTGRALLRRRMGRAGFWVDHAGVGDEPQRLGGRVSRTQRCQRRRRGIVGKQSECRDAGTGNQSAFDQSAT